MQFIYRLVVILYKPFWATPKDGKLDCLAQIPGAADQSDRSINTSIISSPPTTHQNSSQPTTGSSHLDLSALSKAPSASQVPASAAL